MMNAVKTMFAEPIVRHEAGEALGAIGDILARDILKKFTKVISHPTNFP